MYGCKVLTDCLYTGITPSHDDWRLEDCLRFQDLVVNKKLVSFVMEIVPDIINSNNVCIGLQIIDTLTDEDINIAETLVNEGRAVFN